MKVNDRVSEEKIIAANSKIFDVLSFDIVSGSFDLFKNNPKAIVISEPIALKYFGETLVAGRVLNLKQDNFRYENGEKIDVGIKGDFVIAAVIKKYPKKSLFNPQIILPIENTYLYSLNKGKVNYGFSYGYKTFFSLINEVKIDEVLNKINKIGLEIDQKHNGKGTVYSMQAIEDIHLYSDNVDESHTGSIKDVWFYFIIGVLALIISLLNFLLLYTAINKRRLKEFSIQKFHGLTKTDLLKSFFFEAIGISVLSSGLAIILMKTCIPLFNDFTHSRLKYNVLENYQFVLLGCLLIAFIAILAGIYFTFYVWRHNAVEVLKNNNSRKGTNFFLKSGAVVVQVSIVFLMLVFMIGVYKQIDFMIYSDKGYSSENIISSGSILESKLEIFKEELEKSPLVEYVSRGYSFPTTGGTSEMTTTHVNGEVQAVKVNINIVDVDFIPMYQLKLLTGRNFNEHDYKDAVVVNEAAVKYLGLKENPIGDNEFLGNIIGVVKDFHFSSFHKKIEPYVFHLKKKADNERFNPRFYRSLSIKHKEGEFENTKVFVNQLKEDLNLRVFPVTDQDTLYEIVYDKEKSLQKSVLVFTGITIFITILGLIGMSLFKTQQKTKEIGIRKVNGATISEIMMMLNKDFIKWVLLAFIIACPIAYYVMNKWLENFAYKTTLDWWIFVLAGLFTLIVALLTVSWQSYRAATRNPVESLRDE